MFQRLFQIHRLHGQLFHYLEKDPNCATRHKKHQKQVKKLLHDKTLFDKHERDADAAFADLEKPEFIPGFMLICKDAERLVHCSVVQKMPGLDYLNHDDQDFQNLRVSLFQCVSDSF